MINFSLRHVTVIALSKYKYQQSIAAILPNNWHNVMSNCLCRKKSIKIANERELKVDKQEK